MQLTFVEKPSASKSRFQLWAFSFYGPWGLAPGCVWNALLALGRDGACRFTSVKGAVLPI